MAPETLDEIDKGIIYLLQQDARNLSAPDMAERLPVSPGTVRNRLSALEERGVIDGYVPRINYEAAGYPLSIVYSCEAPITDREDLARQAADVPGVVSVREMSTGVKNVRVFAVVSETDEISEIARQLTEIGLTVRVEELLNCEHQQPCERFVDAVRPEP